MSEIVRLLKGIIKTSGWTQEQVAEKLGVSFQTMNAWVNGRSRPRKTMMKRIRALYLAQDITKDTDPTYITLVKIPRWLRVGDTVILEKEPDNDYDEEAILATALEQDEVEINETEDEFLNEYGALEEYLANGERAEDSFNAEDCIWDENIYVANSINTVVRGTKSAGRIYDRFDEKARAKILFIFHRTAIARVVEWNYQKSKKPEKGVDTAKKVRYNGNSLSKSAFPTSTKKKKSEDEIEVAFNRLKIF